MSYKIKFLDGSVKEFNSLEGADLRGADLRDANLRGAYLKGADLRGADLEGATLKGDDLEGADLRLANLRKANLRNANLRNANLEGANLRGSDLSYASVKSFTLGRDFGFYHENYVKIGCIGMSLEEWLEKYEEIGKEEGYSEKDIKAYGIMLNALQAMEDIL